MLVFAEEVYREATSRANRIVEDFYSEDRVPVMKFHGAPTRQFQCGAASREFVIAPDGSVYPCQALLKDEFRAGDVMESKFQDIFYDSPIMKKVRHCTMDNIVICRDCEVKDICGGGCRSLAYNLHGKIDGCISYNCEYLKNMVYSSFWSSTSVPVEDLRDMQEKGETTGRPPR